MTLISAPKNLISCRACQKEISPNAIACPHCGEPIKKPAQSGSLVPLLIVFFLVLAVAAGKIHIITGRNVGFELAAREGFGYSEIVVNADEITGMPWIAAKSRFPLGCRLLQEKGYIESDDHFRERLSDETQKRVEAELKKYK